MTHKELLEQLAAQKSGWKECVRIGEKLSADLIQLGEENARLRSIKPFHAPSEVPEYGRGIFSIWLSRDNVTAPHKAATFRPEGKWWISSDSECFYKEHPIYTLPAMMGDYSLEKQWEWHRELGEPDTTMLAWAYEDEIYSYFMGMFYRTPKPVLDYIGTWGKPTTEREFEITPPPKTVFIKSSTGEPDSKMGRGAE